MRRGDDAAEWDEVEQLLRDEMEQLLRSASAAARHPGPAAGAEAGPAKAAAVLGVAGRLEVKLES